MKKIIVTTSWDDGHVLDLKLAELLRKYYIPATFYISPRDREIKESERLTDHQILELSKNFEIGAHTMNHPRLSKIGLVEAKKEILDSKNYLEKLIGKPVTSFCYPGGDYVGIHRQIVRDAGFIFARTVERFSDGKNSDQFLFPTTIHTYRHWSDAIKILRIVGVSNFLNAYLNWDELAIILFDKTIENGGIFHLWGHSWEIEKNKDWKRLERVFKYISNKNGVDYITNSEII